MSGIYIKGMEMPRNCSSCPFCFGANNICPWVREYATCKGRHKDCPLIPVPPHGRLIDALGELPTFTQDWSYNTWMYTDDVYNAIKELPPIRPKKGRWIGKYPVSSICSECGYLINDSKVKVFAFCPNCGADMREGNDEKA